MGLSAGWSNTETRRPPRAELCTTPSVTVARTGGGRFVTGTWMQCVAEWAWPRRWQQSVSAGFWAACRSSVTEMTGNRIRRSTASATSCMRRSVPLREAMPSHRLAIKAASITQARFRASSILKTDSTSGEFGRGDGPALRSLTGIGNNLMMIEVVYVSGALPGLKPLRPQVMPIHTCCPFVQW
jgi:hypothetical protein